MKLFKLLLSTSLVFFISFLSSSNCEAYLNEDIYEHTDFNYGSQIVTSSDHHLTFYVIKGETGGYALYNGFYYDTPNSNSFADIPPLCQTEDYVTPQTDKNGYYRHTNDVGYLCLSRKCNIFDKIFFYSYEDTGEKRGGISICASTIKTTTYSEEWENPLDNNYFIKATDTKGNDSSIYDVSATLTEDNERGLLTLVFSLSNEADGFVYNSSYTFSTHVVDL